MMSEGFEGGCTSRLGEQAAQAGSIQGMQQQQQQLEHKK